MTKFNKILLVSVFLFLCSALGAQSEEPQAAENQAVSDQSEVDPLNAELQFGASALSFGALDLGFAFQVLDIHEISLRWLNQASLPVFLAVQDQELDTFEFETTLESFIPFDSNWGLAASAGLWLNYQDQILGQLTEWGTQIDLMPGVEVSGLWMYALIELRLGLILWYVPSQEALDHFPQSPSGEMMSFAFPSFGMKFGAGMTIPLLPLARGERAVEASQSIDINFGLIPPLYMGLEILDGMSWGEVPFFMAIRWNCGLGL